MRERLVPSTGTCFSGELSAVSPRPGVGHLTGKQGNWPIAAQLYHLHIILPEDKDELLWVWKERMKHFGF